MVEDGNSSLFDRVLVVSFNAASTKPEITYTFPPPTQGKDSKDIDSVSEFCYPEAHSELLLKINSSDYQSETFSFVLTDSLGGKTYGYCRRFKAEKELECFCILSHIPSFSLFSQILDIVESRRKVSTTLVYSFLKTVLAQIFPAPGQTLSIKTFSASKTGEMDVYNLTRPNDEFMTAYVSFYNLFHWLALEDILKVWEYMLCERRVIFCSRHLGTLSACINALCALLYPFSWQHIFIPILPQSLIHFVTAPMPFLCGILSSSKNTLNGFPLDEVIMLDLDDKEFTLDYPFERVLPIPQFCTLKNNLRKLMRSGKRGKEFDTQVAKYFLLFFYTIFRDYKKFITPAKPLPVTPVPDVKEQNSKKKVVRRKPKGDFDRTAFIKSQNDESTQKFLELFGSSQMFETFIIEREEAAVVGSATLPDCSFLTLCSDTLHDNLYSGTVECERCGKGVPLRHTCSYEIWHFHPQCFECKRCHGPLVYDDFNEIVVQINNTTQDPANKVRTICANCEATGGNSTSSASSFLKRMKHAVAKKIDLGTSGKKEEDKTPEKPKPIAPPPVASPPPPPVETSKPPASPKPLPVAPRAPRNKLVPPDPNIVRSAPNLTQTPPPPVTKPRSGSGSSAPRPNLSSPSSLALDPPARSSVTPPASKPASYAQTPRPITPGQPTNQAQTPRPVTPGQSTNQAQTPRPITPGRAALITKPRSGSVGRPSIAPNVGPAADSQPTTTTSSTKTSSRPRSGSVGRPVPETEDAAGPSLMSHHRSPLSNSSLSLYKPYPAPHADAKSGKQLPTPPPSGASAHRAEANNRKPNQTTTATNNSNTQTTSSVSSIVNAANKTSTTTPSSSFNKPGTPPPSSTSSTSSSFIKPGTPPGTRAVKPPARPQNSSFTGPSIGSHHPVPVLMKSKSVPDSRKSNVVLDEPPSQICTLCKKPFSSPTDSKDTPYRIVSTNDAFYHPACFVCAHCGKAIETAYVTRDRRAYHRDCASKIAHTCAICNKPILSQYLEFQGKIIHKECFTCVSCKEPLAKIGSKYVELDGHSYCLDCTKNRPTKS